MKEKKSVWDTIEGYYTNICPKCSSDKVEPLNEYKGHFKKHISKETIELLGLIPDELKNKRKYRCLTCNHTWWENENIL